MPKLFILIAVVVLGLAAVVFFLKPGSMTQNKQSPLEGHSTSNKISDNTQNQTESLENVQQQNNSSKLISEQLFTAIEPNAVRQVIVPEHFKHIEDGFLFSFDLQQMAKRQVNDQFNVKMLKFGVNRIAKIQSKDELEDGIIRWKGTFEHYPADINYFTITQSQQDQYAIVKIFTDQGSYIAEIKDGIGLAKPEKAMTDDALHSH